MTGASPRRVLVDTNVVIDLLRARPVAIDTVRERVASGDALCMSVLSRFEIRSGARPNELREVTEHLSLYEPVDVTSEVADRAGELAARYRRSHRAIDAIDYVIAATSELHADELLTLNVKHFPMIADLRPAYRITS